MKWTAEKPTKPGWYWWRHSQFARIQIARVNDKFEVVALNELFSVADSDHVDECGGEWQGPIEPEGE